MSRTRIAAALVLCLAGGILSLILLSKHYGVPLLGEAVLAACGEGGGCDVVAQSRYSSFLGLPLAAWGVFFYGSLLALLAPALVGRSDENPDPGVSLGFFLAALAVAIDLVLFGLQATVIKAYCKFCIATYAVNLLIIFALWPYRRFGVALNFFFTRTSRRALVAFMVTSLSIAAAAAAGNTALADRKTLAQGNILGLPLGLPTMAAPEARTAPEKGSIEEELALARAEAKKWKDTLDDPRRLEIYLNQKAQDDFNNAEVATIDLSRSPFLGPKNAPIAVVSYSDFMCPFCRDLAAGLKNYLPTAGGRVKSYYKHFPLDTACNPSIGQSVHPGACELALGGICADESGRFWEYHDGVFAKRWDRATREDVLSIGVAAGLDRGSLGKCMDSAAVKGRLAREVEEGARIGVGSTPTILVNGRKIPSTGVFLLAVEEERKRLKLPPFTGAPPPKEN